ncbi:hypothetical protein FACI_IFERC00001G1233 [Ferroplasma acidarmanus Fer1]|uniref:Uncharacterized protein n=1 Tax=Ferroplasma acidarmanus Fer1 TaxID=333146 RepID=S0APL7_FERAC|nr:hypothetical protein FACI_IFERC00001G1233 [Ferroplasma acidarmanus Fer1]
MIYVIIPEKYSSSKIVLKHKLNMETTQLKLKIS